MAPSVGMVRFLLRLAILEVEWERVGLEDVVSNLILVDWRVIIDAQCVV